MMAQAMASSSDFYERIIRNAVALQSEINAAGMGDPRDKQIAELTAECDQWQKKVAECWTEIASLRAWKQEAETFMANSLETWDAQNKEIERLKHDNELAANELVEYAKLAADGDGPGRYGATNSELRAEIKRLKEAIRAYLENDSQENWDRLAALVPD